MSWERRESNRSRFRTVATPWCRDSIQDAPVIALSKTAITANSLSFPTHNLLPYCAADSPALSALFSPASGRGLASLSKSLSPCSKIAFRCFMLRPASPSSILSMPHRHCGAIVSGYSLDGVLNDIDRHSRCGYGALHPCDAASA